MINQEFGITKYKLLHIKQISNKVLLYSTGKYAQYLVIMEKNLKNNIYTYMKMNHFAVL